MKKGKKDYTKGFTLIELLVVIAIIAILSTVVMAGLNSARLKGRDAKRLSDIKQVQSALELFYDSCAGYPVTTSWLTTGITCPTPGTGTLSQFINPLPTNPSPGGVAYTYAGTASAYTIGFSLEGPAGSLGGPASHTATPSGII